MDRRELEIMLNEAFDRGIVSVGHLVHETVEVGFLNELGRTVGFTLNGWKEAIETIPVDLFDSFDDGRGRERFLSDCKALGGKVPQNTYRGELVSALADVLMVEEAAPALGALESALDSARRKGYCVFDRGVHGDVPAHIEQQVGNMRYDLTTGQVDTVVPGAGATNLVFGADGRPHVELTTGSIRQDLGRPGFDTLL